MLIRDATPADLPGIVAIYNDAVPGRLATADTDAISVASRIAWFREHDASRHPLWVAVSAPEIRRGDDAPDAGGGAAANAPHRQAALDNGFGAQGPMLGWLSYQPFYGRPAYRATAELSVYVAPSSQHAGVGRALLTRAIDAAPALGLSTLLGFIFGHNAASLALFESCGFQRHGLLPRVAELDGVERDLVLVGRRTG